MIEERAPIDDDRDALFDLHAECFREHVIATWGAWDDTEKRQQFDDGWGEWCTGRVLTEDGAVIGYYRVEHHDDRHFLDLIELAASHQGRGIGAALVARLLGEARAAGRPLELSVLQVNRRARAFYERLGFAAVAETRERCRMSQR